MSVTFWMPQAPVMRVQPYPEDDPDYWDEVPVPPFTEINMANGNAADLMRLIDPAADPYCGVWAGSRLDSVHRSTMRLLNLKPESFAAPDFSEKNFYMQGRDMDYVTRRLTQMLQLLTVAKQHGFYICYG